MNQFEGYPEAIAILEGQAERTDLSPEVREASRQMADILRKEMAQ